MLLFIIILLTIEVLSFFTLKDYFNNRSKPVNFIIMSMHLMLSVLLWFLFIKIIIYKGTFDTPANVADRMNLTGMICGVIVPRFVLILLHYSGKLLRLKKGGYIRWMTRSGLIFACFVLAVVATGTFFGRFNFKTEEIKISYKDLPPGLNGIRIVHISDLHLAGFYRHEGELEKVMDRINLLDPDIIINTGDFVTYGWREFDRFDTILSKAKSKYGSCAISGNHDAGTYMPLTNEEDKGINVLKINESIISSGYILLGDENIITNINGSKVAFIGVTTGGRHPGITHGDLDKAMKGTDSADFRILLAHDPNQWEEDVSGKTDIDLTLSGHTHGMQIGIITKRFRWSPSKYFYPNWGGLYRNGEQVLYVNRGLGVLAIPFRIWMPPEITVITLESG